MVKGTGQDQSRSIRRSGAHSAAANGSVLQKRVQQRLEDLHLTARGASLEAKLGPDAVRTILTGRSRSPRAENLAALAKVLQCDVSYLLGEQATPFSSDRVDRKADGMLTGIVPLIVAERLQVGFLPLDGDSSWPPMYMAPSQLMSLPQYLPGYQALEELYDHSFDRMFPQGTLLHVLYVSDWEGFAAKDGDLVILVRQRLKAGQEATLADSAGEVERSLRRVRQVGPGDVQLETMSSNPRLQSAVAWEGPHVRAPKREGDLRLDTIRNESLAIEGFVLRAHLHLSGPPIVGEPFRTWEELDAWQIAAGMAPSRGDA